VKQTVVENDGVARVDSESDLTRVVTHRRMVQRKPFALGDGLGQQPVQFHAAVLRTRENP
jgi:hypothetical protein